MKEKFGGAGGEGVEEEILIVVQFEGAGMVVEFGFGG